MKLMGWMALGSFVTAILILLLTVALLVFFPIGLSSLHTNVQTLLIVSDVISLTAAVLGLFSIKTQQGFIGGLGGMALFTILAVLLSFTLIMNIKTI
jgi:hypothetical protein